MKKKLVERIQFIKRKDLSKLHAAIPLDSLPPNMGGTLDVTPADKWWWVEPERRAEAHRSRDAAVQAASEDKAAQEGKVARETLAQAGAEAAEQAGATLFLA